MTLILDLDLDVRKLYLRTINNEVSRPMLSKVIAGTDKLTYRHTHRQTRPNALPRGSGEW